MGFLGGLTGENASQPAAVGPGPAGWRRLQSGAVYHSASTAITQAASTIAGAGDRSRHLPYGLLTGVGTEVSDAGKTQYEGVVLIESAFAKRRAAAYAARPRGAPVFPVLAPCPQPFARSVVPWPY